ncbi:hypothetical protein DFP72DRAFT_868424, partial [Ephemerocybe angulata]
GVHAQQGTCFAGYRKELMEVVAGDPWSHLPEPYARPSEIKVQISLTQLDAFKRYDGRVDTCWARYGKYPMLQGPPEAWYPHVPTRYRPVWTLSSEKAQTDCRTEQEVSDLVVVGLRASGGDEGHTISTNHNAPHTDRAAPGEIQMLDKRLLQC